MRKKKNKKEQGSIAYPGRTKADPVTVEASLDFDTIRLKLIATPDNWKRFETYFLKSEPAHIQSDFLFQFILPAMEKIKGETTSERKKLIHCIKTDSKWLFSFFLYWRKTPLEEVPKGLKKIKETLERYKPQDLTKFCIEHWYAEEIKRYKLTPFDKFNFYQRYIKETTPPLQKELYNMFFRGQPPDKIFTYASLHPFKDIFESLKML